MKLKIISWIPAVILMAAIFSFSAKPAVNSNENSLFIANHVLNIYENITDTVYAGNTRTDMLNKINHVVRKGAHFSEYALLSFTFAFPLLLLNRKGKRLLFTPVVLSALYAATDEIHQYFVPGRSCRLSDVILDSCGAAAGALLFTLLHLYYLRKKEGQSSVKPE